MEPESTSHQRGKGLVVLLYSPSCWLGLAWLVTSFPLKECGNCWGTLPEPWSESTLTRSGSLNPGIASSVNDLRPTVYLMWLKCIIGDHNSRLLALFKVLVIAYTALYDHCYLQEHNLQVGSIFPTWSNRRRMFWVTFGMFSLTFSWKWKKY